MTKVNNKPAIWFWIISILALLWNAIGVMAYLGRAFITDDMIAALPESQQAEFLVEYPAWYTAAFAIAVFAGALGSLSLLIRKKWAHPLFMVSAFGAIIQHIYLFINVEMNLAELVMPILVVLICLFLVSFSKRAITKAWIN